MMYTQLLKRFNELLGEVDFSSSNYMEKNQDFMKLLNEVFVCSKQSVSGDASLSLMMDLGQSILREAFMQKSDLINYLNKHSIEANQLWVIYDRPDRYRLEHAFGNRNGYKNIDLLELSQSFGELENALAHEGISLHGLITSYMKICKQKNANNFSPAVIARHDYELLKSEAVSVADIARKHQIPLVEDIPPGRLKLHVMSRLFGKCVPDHKEEIMLQVHKAIDYVMQQCLDGKSFSFTEDDYYRFIMLYHVNAMSDPNVISLSTIDKVQGQEEMALCYEAAGSAKLLVGANGQQWLIKNLIKKMYDDEQLLLTKEQYSQMMDIFVNDVFSESLSLSVTTQLGKGFFGEVHKGHFLDSEVAIKSCLVENMNSLWDFSEEAYVSEALRDACNPEHVTQLKSYGVHSGKFVAVYEFMKYGSLDNYIKNKNPNIDQKNQFLKQVAVALQEIHAKGFVHRDIASRNLFVTEDLEGHLLVKIGDFGRTKHDLQYEAPATDKGPVFYCSPGELISKVSTPYSDLWQYAVTMTEIFNEKIEVISVGSHITNVLSGKPLFIGDESQISLLQEVLYYYCYLKEQELGFYEDKNVTPLSISIDAKKLLEAHCLYDPNIVKEKMLSEQLAELAIDRIWEFATDVIQEQLSLKSQNTHSLGK